MLGETINGYRITARLGRGSMGEVWMAEQQIVNSIRVAIKFLLADWSSDPTVVQRFFDEARAVSQIKHAGIAKIHDVGYHRGLPYLIMDLLEGETLAARIAQHGPLAITRVGELGKQIASALKATHAAGIIHRDLKPENIFLVRDDEPPGGERAIVLDFGIAKINSAVGGTGSGNAMGTPGYMAPELWIDASRADTYTDVYALGCIAFEMCCGRKPFLITGVPDAYHKHMFEVPPRMSALVPGVPRELDAIIARALAKRPVDRPTMRELHHVFSTLALARPPDHWTGAALPPQVPPWRSAAPRSRLIAIGAGALAGLAGVAAVLYATSGHTRASLIATPDAPVAPLDNRWVRIPIPDNPFVLGLARDDERAAVRGFRPVRRILSPTAPYELQEHEVTWSEIEPWLVASATRLVLPPWAADRAARRALPVTGATWSIARAYCESLGGSLPTEEQWELAARGAERRPNSWGRDRLDRRLTPVYAGASAVPAPVMTSLQDRTPPPVVYDLIGNVQEWTLGLWRTDELSDDSWSTIGKTTTIRAIRGLPLGDDPPPSIQDETAAYREELCATGPCVARTADKLPLVGFRCARAAR